MSGKCFTFAVAFQKNDLLTCADMAQLVEQRIRNAWVTSSSLVIGSTRTRLRGLVLFCFAAIAQLVEQRLPKPQVTGSSPACRSDNKEDNHDKDNKRPRITRIIRIIKTTRTTLNS